MDVVNLDKCDRVPFFLNFINELAEDTEITFIKFVD